MQHADTQAVTYLRPECTVRGCGGGGVVVIRGVGLARSTELAKGQARATSCGDL